jgi:hypothetical protein
MYEIDYEKVIANYESMINTLEYDSMRSQGKAKINADTLYSMIKMRDVYKELTTPVNQEVKKNGK